MTTQSTPPSTIRVRVRSMTRQTAQILTVVLESLDRQALPPFEPGAHIDVRLGAGLVRSYSIVGHAGHASRYEIAVALDTQSRGGARYVHEKLRVGDDIDIAPPRNLFALVKNSPHSVLIAGGIGITPLWAMVQALEQCGQAWTLWYAVRSRTHAAYLEEIESLAAQSRLGRLFTHFDDEAGGVTLDLPAVLASAPAHAHLYCCGPAPMLAAYEQAAVNRPADHVHLERFAAQAPQPESGASSFELVLARSGQKLDIPATKSILDVLLDNGIDAPFGCMQGVCGMCEVPVLGGTPDHRDHILSEHTRQANTGIIVCCSRSLTRSLTIDL